MIDGLSNGKGKKTYKDGKILDNSRKGYGILIRPDGTKYKGNLK